MIVVDSITTSRYANSWDNVFVDTEIAGESKFWTSGRLRLLQLALASLVLLAARWFAGWSEVPDWWLFVGFGTCVSAVILEPHFTDSRAAILNAVGGIGAAIGAMRGSVEALWVLFVAACVTALVSGIVGVAANPSRLRSAARWIAGRLGRARVLGFAALGIEVMRLAMLDAASTVDPVALAVGLAVAALVITIDWQRLLSYLPDGTSTYATVEFATEPNLLMISHDEAISPDTRVLVRGSAGSADGVVVARMAHRSGNRLQIVLDRPWTEVATRSGAICSVSEAEGEDSTVADAVGFACEGSTERTLEIHPLRELRHGQPVILRSNSGDPIIYQVTKLDLRKVSIDSSTVIEARAQASQVGTVADGEMSLHPHLPLPYQQIEVAQSVSSVLPGEMIRIGTVAGTQIEVGVHPSLVERGHLAILGMSGMGKTTVARRLTTALQATAGVVAVDGTGEYRSKLSFDTLPKDSSLDECGAWVHEPAGDPPEMASKFVNSLMEHASREYKDGASKRRVVLLEEAHTFVPEWNFANRTQNEWVAKTARYILQSRKFGINFVFVSQRTAVISKSALSQCESYIIFRTLDQTSLDYIDGVIGASFRDAVASLPRHHAICVGPAFNCSSPVIVKLDP